MYKDELGDENQLDIPGDPETTANTTVVNTPEMEQWVKTIEMVSLSDKYNFEACKVRVNYTWNVELLADLLQEYHDKEIVELLTYGFPIERNMETPLELGGTNHMGATQYQAHIDAYN